MSRREYEELDEERFREGLEKLAGGAFTGGAGPKPEDRQIPLRATRVRRQDASANRSGMRYLRDGTIEGLDLGGCDFLEAKP